MSDDYLIGEAVVDELRQRKGFRQVLDEMLPEDRDALREDVGRLVRVIRKSLND